MKKYFAYLIFNFSLSSVGQDFSKLENGKYETQYDDINRESSQFEICGNKYYTFQDGIKKNYEIVLLSNCSFQLKINEKIDQTKLTEF